MDLKKRSHLIQTAYRCQCPNCQKGPLFKSFLSLVEECPECHLKFSDHDSGDGPAFFIIFFLGFIVVGLALYVEILFEPALWVHFTLWPIFIITVSIASLRYTKAYLIALQFKHGQLPQEGHHD